MENQEPLLSKRELRRKRRLRNQIIAYVCSFIILIIMGIGCYLAGKQVVQAVERKRQEQIEQDTAKKPIPEEPIEERKDPEEEVAVKPEEDLLEELIATYIAQMSLEEKVAGLFFVTPEDVTGVGTVIQAGEGTKTALQEYPVGGLIYFAKNIQSESQLKEMIENTITYSKYPLFVGIDEEGGSVARIANADLGVAKVSAMGEVGASGDEKVAKEAGTTIAGYLKYYGFNVNFAPVADILETPESPLKGRSFGSDPVIASKMVTSFLEGLQENKVSGCVKHFPGLGSVVTDTHEALAVSEKTLEELREKEFLPFKAGMEAGTDFVMVGHIALPTITGDQTPASLSSKIITDLLRTELGYQGIVITDALNMKAITNQYEAEVVAVEVLKAGADMILMPADFKASYAGVLEALKSGELQEERINESLHRIYRIKYKDALQVNN